MGYPLPTFTVEKFHPQEQKMVILHQVGLKMNEKGGSQRTRNIDYKGTYLIFVNFGTPLPVKRMPKSEKLRVKKPTLEK